MDNRYTNLVKELEIVILSYKERSFLRNNEHEIVDRSMKHCQAKKKLFRTTDFFINRMKPVEIRMKRINALQPKQITL